MSDSLEQGEIAPVNKPNHRMSYLLEKIEAKALRSGISAVSAAARPFRVPGRFLRFREPAPARSLFSGI